VGDNFDPYRVWLGIPAGERPPNHYRLLGVGLFESDPEVISSAADRQMAHVRTFQGGQRSDLSQRILNELSAAMICLIDPARRAEYDAALQARLAATGPPPGPPPGPPTPPPGITAPPVELKAPIVAGVRLSDSNVQVDAPVPTARAVAVPVGTTAATAPAAVAVGQTMATDGAQPAAIVRSSGRSVTRRRRSSPTGMYAALGGAAALVLLVLIFVMTMGGGDESPGETQKPAANPPPQSPANAARNGTKSASPAAMPGKTIRQPSGGEQAGASGAAKTSASARDPIGLAGDGPAKAPAADSTTARVGDTPKPPDTLPREPAPGVKSDPPKPDPSASDPGATVARTDDPQPLPPTPSPPMPPAPTPAQPAATVDWSKFPFVESSAKKPSLPPSAELAAERNRLRRLYRDEFAKARDDATRTELAKRLVTMALETKDNPTARYVILQEARELTVELNNPTAHDEIVAEMAALFDVSATEMKTDGAIKFLRIATDAEQLGQLAANLEAYYTQALAERRYDVAERALRTARLAARKAKDLPTATRLDALAGQLETQSKLYTAAVRAAVRLAEDPSDPAANLLMGRYQCFAAGDWKLGLTLLAKGSDEDLKQLSQRDLASPQEAARRMVLGDDWAALARRLGGTKTPLAAPTQRALHWYRMCIEQLDGLDRVRVQQQIDELAAPANPPTDKGQAP